MTNTVILTVGASASGKTSWAKLMTALHGDMVIACRDDIRRMMGFPPVGDKYQEKTVTVVQRGIIETALLAGRDVIVADTNLNKQLRKNLIKFCHEHGADVKLQVFDVPLEELHKRTDNRPLEEQVPRDAIKRQHDSLQSQIKDGTLDTVDFPVQSYAPYKARNNNAEGVVIVDIDGTVADHTGVRSPYDYTKVGLDKTHEDVIEVVQALQLADHKVIFVSGREDSCREATEDWIYDNILIKGDLVLYMREAGDTRPDWIVKNEIYDREIIPNYDILCVLDDRDQVVRHLRRRGIRVLQVAEGRF